MFVSVPLSLSVFSSDSIEGDLLHEESTPDRIRQT